MEVAMEHKTITSDDESSFGSEVDTDVEDAAEASLKTRKPRHRFSGTGDTVSGLTKAGTVDGEPSENTAYLDKYGGAIEDLNIQKLLNSVQYVTNSNGVTKPAVNAGEEVIKAKSKQIEEEIMEEEVVELEFENAIPKLHTHTMHCPKCNHHITKVVLRRKFIKSRPSIAEEHHEPVDLLGCFSCFSLFTSTGNGGFNPFHIFGNKPSAIPPADGNDVVGENGNCFSIFRVFSKKDSKHPKLPGEVDEDSKRPKQDNIDQEPEQPKNIVPDYKEPKPEKFDPIRKVEGYRPNIEGGASKPENQLPAGGVKLPEKPDELSINILPDTSTENQVQTRGSTRQDSTSFEILKSIVYGGLMEVIASLSIVASAAAGDATTLSIIALALANLIGGVFVIGHNLWDLKDDCNKYSTQETSNQESRNKYKELLGSVEHFPLHAFFAILSFLVFGIIPPLAYGYTFHETNDNDFTMLIVAIASFVCVGLLAIFKAYIDRCTEFAGYVKIIMYYLTTAVTVSGVSYAAGNLVKRLIEELGWFETGSNVGISVVPDVMSTNPSLAYY